MNGRPGEWSSADAAATAEKSQNVDAMGYMMLGVGGIFGVPILIEGAVIYIPYMIQAVTWTGRTFYNGARAYHYTIGRNDGYANVGIDYGLQKLIDPNGSVNYYATFGAGFIPGNSLYKVGAFEVSTTMIRVHSDKVGVGLPDSGTSASYILNTFLDIYSYSKFGTPFLGLYWKATATTIEGKIKEQE
jgi:hypothetical protein